MALSSSFPKLLSYPQREWGTPASARWLALTDTLSTWITPCTSLTLTDPRERKWELVSAYQKCVRRGWNGWAQQLIGALHVADHTDTRYFWTRVSTTACEDVGYGDPELMRFVIACSILWPPASGSEWTRTVWSFLTAAMCDAQRSRIHCQLSLLEDWTVRERISPRDVTEWEHMVLTTIRQLSDKEHAFWGDARGAWSQKNNWRGQNMLKFADYPLPLSVTAAPQDPPPHHVLCGLPGFTYDMHTRVGNRARVRLCAEPEIGEFLRRHPTPKRTAPIGWALFLLEGGIVADGLGDARLSHLEEKCLAATLAWDLAAWLSFKGLMNGLLRDGRVNAARRHVLSETYECPV
jgi:hypothetical protein